MKKRYVIDYCSAPTGYGWREETDSMSEVRKIVRSESFGRNISSSVDVWDRVKKDFIFIKRAFDYKAELDLIG